MRPIINTLSPVLSQKFSGVIWKIKLHQGGLIAVESRNVTSKRVSFSTFNFNSGETNFKECSFEESWNLTLAYVGANNLIINASESSQTPQTKGILSVNAKNGQVLWELYNISLNDAQEGGLQVFDSRIQPRKLYWIDHINASVIPPPATVSVPEIIFPENTPGYEIPGFIKHGSLAGDLHVLQKFNKVFISFHEVNHDQIRQRLIVYQGDKVLLDDIMISGIQKLQPEAFFIQQNHLFYVRNKEELLAYLV